jgi:hypothetical protein
LGSQSKLAMKVEEEDTSARDSHSSAQTRKPCIAALDIIETLKPCAVIAGRKKAEKDDSQEWLTVVEIFREKGNT